MSPQHSPQHQSGQDILPTLSMIPSPYPLPCLSAMSSSFETLNGRPNGGRGITSPDTLL